MFVVISFYYNFFNQDWSFITQILLKTKKLKLSFHAHSGKEEICSITPLLREKKLRYRFKLLINQMTISEAKYISQHVL